MTGDWDVVMSCERNPDPPACRVCGDDAVWLLLDSRNATIRCNDHAEAVK
jgi:hypothetical protein